MRFKELIFQVGALAAAIMITHSVYASIIRPEAARHLTDTPMERSIYVILKDYEQESCFILFGWALAILVYKGAETAKQRRLLNHDFMSLSEGSRILPEDSRELSRQLEGLPIDQRNALIPRALLVALRRFDSARNIQDVADAAQGVCQSEGDRLDSELSIIRYVAWAIPSLGFIGTVRGISVALGNAHEALEGDIRGVTENLGVAFNSTLVALLISIVLMFIIHQIQLLQERYILDTQAYCEDRLIRYLYTN